MPHEMEQAHPGFLEAYQGATVSLGFRLMHQCAQIVVARDEHDSRRRSWQYVDTYEAAGDGTYRLAEVDVTPESDDDDSEYYECLRQNRLAAGVKLVATPEMALPRSFKVYDAGRASTGAPATIEALDRTVAALSTQLAEMDPDDPYRQGVESELALYRCYREHGVSRDQRLECLAQADAENPPASPPN